MNDDLQVWANVAQLLSIVIAVIAIIIQILDYLKISPSSINPFANRVRSLTPYFIVASITFFIGARFFSNSVTPPDISSIELNARATAIAEIQPTMENLEATIIAANNDALPENSPLPDIIESPFDEGVATSTLELDAALIEEPSSSTLFGPISGTLPHNSTNQTPEVLSTNVNTSNFVSSATFTNPYNEGKWSYGFIFRSTGRENEYRFLVTSSGQYILDLYDGNRKERITSTFTEAINIEDGQTNSLYMIVLDESALIFINNQYINSLDVSRRDVPGDIMLITGGLIGDEIDGYSTSFTDFTVTKAGKLIQSTNLDVMEVDSSGNLQRGIFVEAPTNFIAEARFFNTRPQWAYGFFFRDIGEGRYYFLSVFSDEDRSWNIEYRDRSDWETTSEGEVGNILNIQQNGSNILRIVAIDDKLYLFVNNEFIGDADISLIKQPGTVQTLMWGYSPKEEGVVEQILYSDFIVWALP